MSSVVGFGTLIDVEARTAWAHEAHVFTPWLADNLDRLGSAIGVAMELTATEHMVGRFSADIIAQADDGRVVLVENQLEWSDHKHLGQIMTYLAGTQAKIIVWVAPHFNEEHLSAIRWLNQHSHEEYSFFAVKLRVVQIGDSPLAPLFDVLEKPNEWERSLNQEVRSQVVSDAGLVRRAFWEAVAQVDPEILNDRATGPGGSNRWRAVPGTDLIVNRYKTKDKVGIWIRTSADLTDEEFIDFMQPYASQLKEALGTEGGEWNTFSKEGPTVSTDPDNWSPAVEWLVAETRRYSDAICRIIPLRTEVD